MTLCKNNWLLLNFHTDVCVHCATMMCLYAAFKFSLVTAVLIYNQLGDAAWLEEESGLSEEYGSNSKAAGRCNIISNNSCPTWFVSSANGTCRCGKSHGIISCDEDRHSVAVLECYCVSYDPNLKEVVAGACFFNCEPHRKHQFTQGLSMILHGTWFYLAIFMNWTTRHANHLRGLDDSVVNVSQATVLLHTPTI